MIEFTVLVNGEEHVLKTPTALKEISSDYLNAVTKNVRISPNYALVAVCIAATPLVLCETQYKNGEAKAVYKLVRKNDPNNVCSASAGDSLIASATDVMRGYEVTSINNILNTGKVMNLIKSRGKDKNGMNIKNPYTDLHGSHANTIIYTVTFKLVPLCDIHGSYSEFTPSEEIDYKNEVEKYYK